MKSSYWRRHPPGTCARIIAHAEYRASRGKRPSMVLGEYRNPRKLLALAKETLAKAQKRALLNDERAVVMRNADRMPKVWLGSCDGRNRGSVMGHHDDHGFCRLHEDLVRVGGDENEWSLYIISVQKVEPADGGFSMGSNGFMPEVRRTGSCGPEHPQRIFGPTDWRGWDLALAYGETLLRERIKFTQELASQRAKKPKEAFARR